MPRLRAPASVLVPVGTYSPSLGSDILQNLPHCHRLEPPQAWNEPISRNLAYRRPGTNGTFPDTICSIAVRSWGCNGGKEIAAAADRDFSLLRGDGLTQNVGLHDMLGVDFRQTYIPTFLHTPISPLLLIERPFPSVLASYQPPTHHV